MTPCNHCGAPVPHTRCPHCHTVRSGRRKTPARFALLGLTLLVGCDGGEPVVALYGAPACVEPDEDADGDGYCASEDCDDADDTVFPGAAETAGDGIDSNCDGEDDT